MDGSIIIKARLCLKGVTKNAKGMDTCAPTASRRSHRAVAIVAAIHGWPMEVLDTGAACLE